MESGVHQNKMFPRRGMIALITFLVQGIPKEDALKALGSNLERSDLGT